MPVALEKASPGRPVTATRIVSKTVPVIVSFDGSWLLSESVAELLEATAPNKLALVKSETLTELTSKRCTLGRCTNDQRKSLSHSPRHRLHMHKIAAQPVQVSCLAENKGLSLGHRWVITANWRSIIPRGNVLQRRRGDIPQSTKCATNNNHQKTSRMSPRAQRRPPDA